MSDLPLCSQSSLMPSPHTRNGLVKKVSLAYSPKVLREMRRNYLVNQVEFCRLAYAFATV